MSRTLHPLQELLECGVRERCFPAAQATVLHRGQTLFEGAAGEATRGTVFDLASVTKVATTALYLALRQRGTLEAETRIGALLPAAVAPQLTLEDLLYHRSGLPAWRPFFAHPEAMPAVLASGRSRDVFAGSRRAVVEGALATRPEGPVATRAVYSDVGFILLGEALSIAAGQPLEQLFEAAVVEPLGLSLGYRPLGLPVSDTQPDLQLAPTGTQRPRPPAPGQEGSFSAEVVAPETTAGEVDDDNAWAMGGVAGHAGLFGTSNALAAFGQAILEERGGAGRLASPGLWTPAFTRDPLTPNSERTLGFDTVSPGGSSAGQSMSSEAVGHLGFTGTSLWIDPARELVVALLTNRTLLGRDNLGIRSFRPRFHDAVAALL